VKISAYTDEKVPRLREKTTSFQLEVCCEYTWTPPVPAEKKASNEVRFKQARAFVKSAGQSGRIVIGFSKDMIIRDALPEAEDIRI